MTYQSIEGGGVTTPQGFIAGASYAGVKSRNAEKPDVAVLYSQYPAACAALFTTNKFCAAPVILDREILKKGKARAVVINSGNANAATGEQGLQDAKLVETEAERLLGLGEDEVFVCSTGVIGQRLPVEKVLDGVRSIVPHMSADKGSAWSDGQGVRYDPPQHGHHAGLYYHRRQNRGVGCPEDAEAERR